jgi:hypothetical protein
VIIAVGVLTSAAGVVQTYLAIRVGQGVMRDLRATLHERLKRMPRTRGSLLGGSVGVGNPEIRERPLEVAVKRVLDLALQHGQ